MMARRHRVLLQLNQLGLGVAEPTAVHDQCMVNLANSARPAGPTSSATSITTASWTSPASKTATVALDCTISSDVHEIVVHGRSRFSQWLTKAAGDFNGDGKTDIANFSLNGVAAGTSSPTASPRRRPCLAACPTPACGRTRWPATSTMMAKTTRPVTIRHSTMVGESDQFERGPFDDRLARRDAGRRIVQTVADFNRRQGGYQHSRNGHREVIVGLSNGTTNFAISQWDCCLTPLILGAELVGISTATVSRTLLTSSPTRWPRAVWVSRNNIAVSRRRVGVNEAS